MKVLVTGGGGYIGSILLRTLLEQGYDVTCLDRLFFGIAPIKDIADEIHLIKADIRWFQPDILKDIDVVCDLASLSNDPSGELDPKKTLDINYRGRVRVAKLSKKQGVSRYILASTCSVYGYQNETLTEESTPNPLTTYARANMLAEKEVLSLSDESFSTTVLRQATVYGVSPRMRFDLAINGMVLGFYKHGKTPIMRNGKQWRPFIHVRDTSKAFMKVLESEQELVNSQIFNTGSENQNVQIFNLAKRIANSIKLPFNYEWYGSPDKRSYRVAFNKIENTLNFQPHYTLEDGAQEVFEALKNGQISGDDPQTITVEWYKHLLCRHPKNVEINGVIL